MTTRRQLLKGLGAAAAGMVGLGGYAFGYMPMHNVVTRYRVSPAGWPPALKLRIAILADIHACMPWMSPARIGRIAAEANGLGADLIVLLGDFTTAHPFTTRTVADADWATALKPLHAPLGVHAVLGNHDWWDDREVQRAKAGRPRAQRALEAVGIPVYENSVKRLAKDGRPFWIAGLGDQLAFVMGRRRYRGVDDLDGTLARITDNAPVILLAHEPDIFVTAPRRVALTLSGHTHGGQVRLLGYSPVVPSRYQNRYAYGHVMEDGRHLVVSGGLGCSMVPVRFGVPPEIVVVDVAAGPAV